MSVLCRDYVGIVSGAGPGATYYVGIVSVLCRYFVGYYVGLPRHTARPPLARRAEKDEDGRLDRYVLALAHHRES